MPAGNPLIMAGIALVVVGFILKSTTVWFAVGVVLIVIGIVQKVRARSGGGGTV